jgi:hypothetical protein
MKLHAKISFCTSKSISSSKSIQIVNFFKYITYVLCQHISQINGYVALLLAQTTSQENRHLYQPKICLKDDFPHSAEAEDA